MQLEFLGTGGNTPTPKPTCTCAVCERAREEGRPYTRCGNQMFLHDCNALIDAPEHTFGNLNRARIEQVDYILLTHWHPDHINGLRVIQQTGDFLQRFFGQGGEDPTIVTTKPVFQQVLQKFGQLRHFIETVGLADLHFLDEAPLQMGDVTVRGVPYPLRENGPEDAVAFVLEQGDSRIVIASDDARDLDFQDLPAADVGVFECGVFDEGPDGAPLHDDDLQLPPHELRHAEQVDRVQQAAVDRAFLTEIEHSYGRSLQDYRALQQGYDGVRFAEDGQVVEV